jgi:hypothetical protein
MAGDYLEKESEMSELNNKVAIVTGASKGIGAGIAKHLAAGAAVAVNYASSREGADTVVAEIIAKGGTAFAVHGDVAKKADVKTHYLRPTTHLQGESGIPGNPFCGHLRAAAFGEPPVAHEKWKPNGELAQKNIVFAIRHVEHSS